MKNLGRAICAREAALLVWTKVTFLFSSRRRVDLISLAAENISIPGRNIVRRS